MFENVKKIRIVAVLIHCLILWRTSRLPYMPEFYLKKYILENFPKQKLRNPSRVQAIDYMVDQVGWIFVSSRDNGYSIRLVCIVEQTDTATTCIAANTKLLIMWSGKLVCQDSRWKDNHHWCMRFILTVPANRNNPSSCYLNRASMKQAYRRNYVNKSCQDIHMRNECVVNIKIVWLYLTSFIRYRQCLKTLVTSHFCLTTKKWPCIWKYTCVLMVCI